MNLKFCCCIFVSLAISLAHSKSIDAKQRKTNPGATKAAHEPKKRISTQQKIGSGHAKGPMANNIQSSVPMPVIMPFPMIPFDNRYPVLYPPNGKPKKGKDKKKDPKNETEDEHDKDVDDESDDGEDQYKEQKVVEDNQQKGRPGPTEESTNNHFRNDNTDNEVTSNEDESSTEGNEVDTVNEEKEEQNDSNDYAERTDGEQQEEDEENDAERNAAQENSNKEVDEEKKAEQDKTQNRNQGSKSKHKKRVRRNAFKPIVGNPEDIMPYLMFDSDVETTTDGNNEHVIKARQVSEQEEPYADYVEEDAEREADAPHVMNVRETDEDEMPHVMNARYANEEEDIPRVMRTRSLPDDAEDLPTAEKKFKDAETAAEALTQIQKALGANPINAVEESHSLADYLRKETEQYDEEIAKDIIATQAAQTRSKIAVNEEGSKRTLDLDNAKRKLESDRAKEDQLRNELKELKDIEFMTTELELAKYLAVENARHQLQFAKAVNKAQVDQASAKAPQYTPPVLQQPAAYTIEPSTPFAPLSQQPMPSVPAWQPVYPSTITYAYTSSQAKENVPATVLESSGRGRTSSDLPNIQNQHTDNSYMWHEFSTPSLDYESRFRNHPQRTNSFHNAPLPRPRPAPAAHLAAQSRHIKKPSRVNMRPYKNNPSNALYTVEKAQFAGARRPTFTFPGPTYSPPPYAMRTSRPRQKSRFRPYNNRYRMPVIYGREQNPALKSFFSDQNHINNYYQLSELGVQQHSPLFTQQQMYSPPQAPAYAKRPYVAAYRGPISYENAYAHTIERQPANVYASSFYSPAIATAKPAANQQAKIKAKQTAQVPAAKKPYYDTHGNVMRPTDYIGPQHGIKAHFALPRPQGPSYGAPATVIYQAPSTYSETSPAAKQGIPSYNQAFYGPATPVAYTMPIAEPQAFYPQNSRPFEVMNTDSNNFHGDQPLTQQVGQQQQQQGPVNMNDPDKVPLGFGIFPVPEGAEEKMEGDSEEKELYHTIKTDKEKLTETNQAAHAVTNIENQVGFDPGSIAKLVDFVKAAAIKDSELSEKAVARDQQTIKRMEIAQKSDNKSEIAGGDVAMNEASKKLKVDQELLKESQDRLDKIKRMELIVTSIEAAKYSALNRKQETLNNDVDKMNKLKAVKKTNIRKAIFGKRASS